MTRRPPTHTDRATALAARARVSEGTDATTVRAAFGFSAGTWHRILAGTHVALVGLDLPDLHDWHRRPRITAPSATSALQVTATAPQPELPLTGHAALDAVRRAAWDLPAGVQTEIGADGEARAHALDLLERLAGYTPAGARRAWADFGQRARAAHSPWLTLAEWWRLRGALPAARAGEEREAQAELAAEAATVPAVPGPVGPVAMLRAMADALEAEAAARAQLASRVDTVAETAARALELADRASRAGVQVRVTRDRLRAATGHISRQVQRHCASRGLDFRATFSAGRAEIGLRPTREGGPSLGKADLRADQVLRLARYFAGLGVAGCGTHTIEDLLYGAGDDVSLEVRP